MDQPLRDNQALWDAWTRIHVPSAFYDVASFRDGSRPIRLSEYEREEVGPVEGRSLLHLQCHFGLDTLSWARLGARVTGLDFSAEAVAAARALAEDVGLEARFVQSNVYDAAQVLDETFDIVYTSRGVLGWLPDIAGWARVAARFVRPGGMFYVTEIHPVAQVFDDEGVAPGELRLRYPYWSHAEPISHEVQGSYADPSAPTEGLREHGWDHSLGEIVTALIDAGLRIELLHELPFVEWPVPFLAEGDDGRYRLPPEAKGELPLFFSLRATRPEERVGPAAPAALSAPAWVDASVRARAALDLHDGAGQSLVAAYRFVEAAMARGGPHAGDPNLDAASRQVMQAMRELRAVMDSLAPPDLAQGGPGVALRAWAERQGRAGVPVTVAGDLGRSDATLEAAAFDLVTAAATLWRRTEGAPSIRIELRTDAGRRMMTLTGDAGRWAPADPDDTSGAATLEWLRRLTARLGGSVRIADASPAETTLVIDLPARAVDGSEPGEERGEP